MAEAVRTKFLSALLPCALLGLLACSEQPSAVDSGEPELEANPPSGTGPSASATPSNADLAGAPSALGSEPTPAQVPVANTVGGGGGSNGGAASVVGGAGAAPL